MNAGQTKIKVGTKVRLQNIIDKDFKELNGLTGTVTHPFAFGCTLKGWVGIWFDEASQAIGGRNRNVNSSTEIKFI